MTAADRMRFTFTYDKWDYDCDGEAYIIRKSIIKNREDVPKWIVENDHLSPEVLNSKYGEHLSVDDVKDGWCKWQVRTDWENGDGSPLGGYFVSENPCNERIHSISGKRKPGWFEVWIVRVGEWY